MYNRYPNSTPFAFGQPQINGKLTTILIPIKERRDFAPLVVHAMNDLFETCGNTRETTVDFIGTLLME